MKKLKKIAKKIFAWGVVINMIATPVFLAFPQEAKAAPVTIILNFNHTILTEGDTWTVPDDWTDGDNTIEVIGGGGAGRTDTTGIAGAGGGGGGAYSKSVNVDLTPGATITYNIGVGGVNSSVNGGDTYVCNATSNCASIAGSAVVVGAKGGLGATSATGAAGGASGSGFAYGTGNVKNSGGNGGTGHTNSDSGGGGGGAGGPNGVGGTGGAGDNDNATDGVGGGGGGNGGGAAGESGIVSDTVRAAGGNNYLGAGGGAGGGTGDGSTGTNGGGGSGGSDANDGGNGSNGGEWTTAGSGGGGGGSGDTTNTVGYGGDGGLYGAGGGGGALGGRGAPGVIIITYNGGGATNTTWTVPSDWNDADNTIEVIGGGGAGYSSANGSGAAAGGGGGYSISVNQNLPEGSQVTYQIGRGGRKSGVGSNSAGANGGDTYLCNSTSNCASIAGSAVVAGAKGGTGGTSATTGGRTGGASGSGFAYGTGSTKTSGGLGGAGNSTGDSGGGGGGAGQRTEAGQAGGGGGATNTYGGGGGGGAGDNSGTDSTAGATPTTTTGGAGGNGRLNTGDAAGTGGGGDGGNNGASGVNGYTGNEWTSAGAGGGGGGAGDNSSVFVSGGNGGNFGGGGGGGKWGGFGGTGIIVITYEPLVPVTTLGDGTDGASSTMAPGASATEIGRFSLVTSSGSDDVTGMTVTLGPANAFNNIATVGVYTTGDALKCSATPGSNAVALTGCAITATTGSTEYVIKITPKTHANMPAVPGASYAVTATVTSITPTINTTAGTDTDSATITVDNASPAEVTSATATAGDTLVNLAWTNPVDADLSRIMVLASTTAITFTPVEGTTYATSTLAGASRVACYGLQVSCIDTSLVNDTAYYYKIFALDSRGNWSSAGVTPTGSPATPTAPGVVISGTIYSDDGSTPYNCSTGNVTVRVAVGGSLSQSVTCTAAGGTYTLPNITGANSGDVITLFIDDGTASKQASLVTKLNDGISPLTLNLYQQRVIVRNENGVATTNANMGMYDSANNANIKFTESSGALIIASGNKLIVWTGDTFTPGGSITTAPASVAANPDGDVLIQSGATLAMGFNFISIGGDFVNSGTFTYGGGTTNAFTATGTGFNIEDGTSGLSLVAFTGVGGGWTFASDVTVSELTITAGNVTVGATALNVLGATSITGTLTISSATGAKTFGSNVTVNASGTWNNSGNADVSIAGNITNNQTFTAGSGVYTMSGASKTINGTVSIPNLTITGTVSNTNTLTVSTALSGAGTLTNASGATLNIGGTSGITTLTPAASANTINYTGGAQTVKVPTTNSYWHLGLSGSGVKTLTSISELAGNLTMSGSVSTSGMALDLIAGSVDISGTAQLTTTASLTVDGGTTVGTGSTLINGNTHTFTSADITINGTGLFTNNGIVVVNSDLSGTGGFTNAATGTLEIGFATAPTITTLTATASGNIVNYTSAAPNCKVTSYHHLNFTGSGTVTCAITTVAGNLGLSTASTMSWTTGANLSVTGTLTVGNGVTLTQGAYTLSVDGATTIGAGSSGAFVGSASGLTLKGNLVLNSGSTWTKGAGTVTFSKGAAQTITDNTASKQDLGIVATATASTNVSTATSIKLTSLTIAGSTTWDITDDTMTVTGTGNPLSLVGEFITTNSTVDYTGNGALISENNVLYGYHNLGLKPDGASPQIFTGSAHVINGNLTIGDGTNAGATADTFDPSIIVYGTVTVSAGAEFVTGSNIHTLLNTGTPLVINGTFTASTGNTMWFSGNGATITAANYYNLDLKSSGASQQILSAGTFNVAGDLTVGNGTNNGATASANDPVINVTGNTTIASGATFTKGSGATTFDGNLTINGTLSGNDTGTITAKGNVTGSGAVSIVLTTFDLRSSANRNFGSTSGSSEWGFGTLIFSNSNVGSTPITITTQNGGSGVIASYSSPQIGKQTDVSGANTTLNAGSRVWQLGKVGGSTNGGSVTLSISSRGIFTAETSTVNYECSLGCAPTISSTTYYNLGISVLSDTNAGITATLGGHATIGGVLTVGNSGSTNVDVLNTSAAGNYSITASSTNITSKGTLVANNSTITLTGTGDVFTNSGTFTPGGSTVAYTNATSANIENTTYNHLSLIPASGTPTYTLDAGTITTNNFTIGGAGGNPTVTGNTNNPTINTSGILTIETGATFNTGGGTVTLSNTGTPLVASGTLASTGTMDFTGNGATVTASTGYYNLGLKPDGASQQVLGAGTFTINGALVVGNGTNAGATAETNDPIINIVGEMNIADNATFITGDGDISIGSGTNGNLVGTLSGSGTGTISVTGNSNFYGSGIVNLTGGTFEFRPDGWKSFGTISGSNDWVFNNLTFGNSSGFVDVNAIVLDGGSGTITVNGNLLIGKSGDVYDTTLDAANRTWILKNTGTPLVLLSGLGGEGILDDDASTFRFEGNGATIPALTYNNLELKPDGASPQVLGTGALQTLNVVGNLVVGDGTNAGATAIANNPTINVTGDTTIAAGATLVSTSGNLTMAGNFTNNGVFTHNSGTVRFEGGSKSASGNMIGTSAFNNLAFINAGSRAFSNNASTTNLTITSGTMTAPDLLSIAGNYSNSGTFAHNNGTTTFNGVVNQTLTGNMIGSSAFRNLEILNNTLTATTTFANNASTTANFYVPVSNARIAFAPSATTTLTNLIVNGQSEGNEVRLWSSTPGSWWGLDVPGTRSISYMSVQDSRACSGNPNIVANVTILNVGNNTCWDFHVGGAPTISSADNQVFTNGGAATSISTITITDDTVPGITAANDIRIAIDTNAVDMLWLTSDTTATIGGTASGKVSTTVSYEEGGSILVIPVNTNFSAGDTLTISGLSFTSFGDANAAAVGLELYTGGAGDVTAESSDDKTVAIRGSLVLGQHSAGPETNKFEILTDSVAGAELYSFSLLPNGETMSITNLVLSLTGIKNIYSGDMTNNILAIDYNSNGSLEEGELEVGGAGVVSIAGASGTVTFSQSFNATTSRNYIFKSDVSNILPLNAINIRLNANGITSTGVTSALSVVGTGSTVVHTNHIRIISSPVPIGGASPSGQGVVSGGGNSGGETIGDDPILLRPTTDLGTLISAGNAYDGVNTTYASTISGGGAIHDYKTFSFTVPGGNIIDGIEVKIEASQSNGARNSTIDAQLSWNNGSGFSAVKTVSSLTTTDTVFTLGGGGDTWGRAWSSGEFSNANFVLRITGWSDQFSEIRIDDIKVKVHHRAGGGGSGGGGDIGMKNRDTMTASLWSIFEKLLNLFKK